MGYCPRDLQIRRLGLPRCHSSQFSEWKPRREIRSRSPPSTPYPSPSIHTQLTRIQIHLHGHDFAILAQSSSPYSENAPVKVNNPPRRDVALLPQKGYLILAFKSDNPGSWLLHCHIAWHASSGLGLQILEREPDINLPDSSKKALDETCKTWKKWYDNKHNWFNASEFQDDSGI